MQNSNLAVNICGISFKNPVIAASGTFGYGLEFTQVYDLSLIGGISVKGISLKEHNGNPMPRIRETTAGMLNAIGLHNIGVDAFLKERLPALRKYDTRIIANFWGRTIDEYVELAAILDSSDIDMLEMNISCPNIKEGGISFSANPESTKNIVREVRKHIKNKPLIVKLSPNVTCIKDFAIICEEEGADAISAINTLMGMSINIKTRKPWLGNVTGGLSGPAIKPVAIKMVYDIYRCVKIPVIGMGGIMNYEDAIEFMLAGASAIQIGTANFFDQEAMPKIVNNLKEYCNTNDIQNISELTGGILL